VKHSFKQSHGGRENHTSVKFKKDRTNDCAIRAIAHACDLPYVTVRDSLFDLAKEMWRMPNDNEVIERWMIKTFDIKRNSPLTHHGRKKYKIGNFPLEGIFIIRSSNHVTCIKDGVLMDTWDCRDWKAQSYYTIENGKNR